MFNKIKKLLSYLSLKLRVRKIKGVSIKSINVSRDIEVGEFVNIPKNVNIRNNVKIGKATYLSPNTTIESNVEIGKYCSFAPNVFIAPGEHYSDFVTTHPFLFDPIWRKRLGIVEKDSYIKNIKNNEIKTYIGNDVWIGLNVIVMRGIKIGDGAIVGAGSVVTKDVPPYAIVAGIPAKVIRYRFSDIQISKIINSKWWNNDLNVDNMYDVKRFGDDYENK